MKRCFTSYIIWEMQMTMTTRCHNTPIEVRKIQNTGSTQGWQDMKQEYLSITDGHANGASTLEDIFLYELQQ